MTRGGLAQSGYDENLTGFERLALRGGNDGGGGSKQLLVPAAVPLLTESAAPASSRFGSTC